MGEKTEKSKAEKLYDILQNDQHYKDVLPDKETFVNKLQDEKFASKFHSILMNDNRYNTVIPEYNSFYKSMQIPVSATESKTVTNNSEITEPSEDYQEKYQMGRKWVLDHLEEVKQAAKENPGKYDNMISYYVDGVLPSKSLKQESAAEVSVRDKTPIEKLGRPILWREEEKAIKESYRDKWRKKAPEIPSPPWEVKEETKVPEGSVAAAMIAAKYPKGYTPDLPKTDAFSLDNIMALTNRTNYYSDATRKIRGTTYDNFIAPIAESEQNKEKRGEQRTVKGLNDQEFIAMLDKYNKDPQIKEHQKLTDDEKAALIIDRRKRQAAGYFDFKNNLNSNISKEDLEACTGEETCRSNTSFNALNPLGKFKDYHKQTIVNTYKDLNPGKEFTKEMEAEVDEFLKLREEEKQKEKSSKLQSK